MQAAIQNPWEEVARGRKVERLVVVLDEKLTEAEIATNGADALLAVSGLQLDMWKDAARLAGVNEPSPVTIERVLTVYRSRVVSRLGQLKAALAVIDARRANGTMGLNGSLSDDVERVEREHPARRDVEACASYDHRGEP